MHLGRTRNDRRLLALLIWHVLCMFHESSDRTIWQNGRKKSRIDLILTGRYGSVSDLHWRRRWDPFHDLQREVGRLFETLDPIQSTGGRTDTHPSIFTTLEIDIILSVQLPGLAPADIDLTITGETLTLRGERKRAEGVKEDSYRRQERPMGRWSRTITLPDRVESTQVSASFADGILTVSLPRAESAKPRQIAVTAVGVSE